MTQAKEPTNRGRLYCADCRLEMTKAVMAFHLRNDHKILKCIICSHPIQRFGISDFHVEGAYCSPACRDESRRRGLCAGCTKPHGFPPDKVRYCSRCRRQRAHIYRQIALIQDQEDALLQATYVPPPYQRTGSSRTAG